MKLPTGGDRVQLLRVARERFVFCPESMAKHKGQQTRFDPGADGHSPDERERDGVCPLARMHLLHVLYLRQGTMPSFALFTQTGLYL